MMPTLSFASPLGELTLTEQEGRITALTWNSNRRTGNAVETALGKPGLLLQARDQILEYFDGARTEFDLPLAPAGSDFQRRVWQAMMAIPYGETRTYGELAKALSSAPRAVGRACGANPIPLIVPCHRVTAASGNIGGYSGTGGIATKQFLLAHESNPPQRSLSFNETPTPFS